MEENKELPIVLTPQDIADYLRIGRKRVYELLKTPPPSGGIKCFHVGNRRRVERRDFLKWVEAMKTG